MIWLWIIIAITLSLLFLKTRDISIENYIWVLLPVDMYGINVGFTIKPYMLFTVLLLIRMFVKNKGKLYAGTESSTLMWLLIPLAIIINVFNSRSQTSVMTALMLAVVYFCALVYVSNTNRTLYQLTDVIVATSIGYGITFIVSYLLTIAGISWDGLFTSERMNAGIVMQFNNYFNNQLFADIRLRGFFIDPNVVVGVFLAPIAVDIFVIFCKGINFKNTLSVIVSLVCIYMTNSRTAFLITIVIVFMGGRFAIRSIEGANKNLIRVVSVSIIIAFMVGLAISGASSYFISKFMGAYHRASLTDANGRLTIWRASINAWNENGLLQGVGFGQMQFFNGMGLECHNTWLEWLCSSGIIIGGFMVAFYIILLIRAIRLRIRKYSLDMLTYEAIMMGYIGIVLALLAVDNITNSYLVFYSVTLDKIQSELRINGTLCPNKGV